MNFEENYAALSDDEVLHVAGSRAHLVPEAAKALDSEMARRRLSYKEAHAKKREQTRLEIKDARRSLSPKSSSKYFVWQVTGWTQVLLALGPPAVVITLMSLHVVAEEWYFPILSVCIGGAVAITAVQPWLRQASNFWIALVVSCVVQLFVGHWLSVHLSRTSAESKGAVLVTIIPGYTIAVLIFLLLQKLAPHRDGETNS